VNVEEIVEAPKQENKSHSNILPVATIALLGVILIALLCNLGATGYLITLSRQSDVVGAASTTESLPTGLNSVQEKMLLFERIREPYNLQDDQSVYALLDPLAQADLPQEKIIEQLSLLFQITGKIENGVYSYYEYKGISQGRKWYILYYRIQTVRGPATLNITIGQTDQEPFTIWGFHIDT
jgi:hypothetical protein